MGGMDICGIRFYAGSTKKDIRRSAVGCNLKSFYFFKFAARQKNLFSRKQASTSAGNVGSMLSMFAFLQHKKREV
jgi:hypothetical protein